MRSRPRGYIAPDQWNFGTTAGFAEYSANYFQSKQESDYNQIDNSSFFTSARFGINLAKWRIRSRLSYSQSGSGATKSDKLNHLGTYATTAIPSWKSELTLGQKFTTSNQFDSIGYTGFEIKSDKRMIPLSQRDYAPVIKGVANSVATVTVSQSGREIYQTTVAPGPFVISDLYSTYNKGNLEVSVKEASGKVSNFTVPFNAVSNSVRPGDSNFSVSGGKLRLSEISDEPFFLEGFYERGISNSLTANTGLRISDNYASSSLGVVYGTRYGAFGLNYKYSWADERDNVNVGWRAGIDYSIGYGSGTTINLAGYLFSNSGYRALNDVAIMNSKDAIYDSTAFDQSERTQLNINVDQSLSDYGHLYLSSSHTTYGGNRDSSAQAQFGYSTTVDNITFNVNYSRTYQDTAYSGNANDSFNVGLSMPLGGSDNSASTLSLDATHSDDTTTYQTSLAGQIKNSENTSYSLAYSKDDERKMYSMSVNHLADKASFGGSYSQSSNYKQWGANIQGGVALHSGGINLSQRLGDSFAIIKADGGRGIAIQNTRGAEIASNGYGIVSYLSPYSVNDIVLDSSTKESKDIELSKSQFQLIPTAGSILEYEIETRAGKAVLVSLTGDKRLPLGTEIKNSEGINVGMVSQNNLAFVRVAKPKGSLYVSMGKSEDKKCVIEYDISDKIKDDVDLVRVSSICK
jgi:P pilus assembly protein, porin PapC